MTEEQYRAAPYLAAVENTAPGNAVRDSARSKATLSGSATWVKQRPGSSVSWTTPPKGP
ncbi:hypothetical protein [Arthrobacter sp. SD76]|uniref:hypothetical protein n=1 Tax=Arthrobacter sp. SD76 TaxID=3415007 RepID=UPI003C77F932